MTVYFDHLLFLLRICVRLFPRRTFFAPNILTQFVFLAWFKWEQLSQSASKQLIDTVRIVCDSVTVTIRCPSVRLSVWPNYWRLQQRAAGLQLWARRAEDIDRLLHDQCPAATAPPQHGTQQATQRSAANASSVTFTAAVEGWTRTYSIWCVTVMLLCSQDDRSASCVLARARSWRRRSAGLPLTPPNFGAF